MAKKKAAKKKKAPKNHLSTQDSFSFALNIAVLAVMIAVLVGMLGQLGNSVRSSGRAAQAGSYPAAAY